MYIYIVCILFNTYIIYIYRLYTHIIHIIYMYIHVLYNIYIHTNIPGKKMMPSSKMVAPTSAPTGPYCLRSWDSWIKWYQMISNAQHLHTFTEASTRQGPPLAVESRGSHTLDTPAAAGHVSLLWRHKTLTVLENPADFNSEPSSYVGDPL